VIHAPKRLRNLGAAGKSAAADLPFAQTGLCE
jgi:hypothetical protein